ncbi:hypothetical protein POTOM_039188 [Populus tomentosa]|uniref:Uncharacterized protein n=1 Tax=Populus tomentosa TaxID=118781 RepID=A0A8X7YM47_POPTO|nr:hypothetical protein POTOM_039188 [Populus tomentosa]
MADAADRARPNREEENRLKHACDAGMVSGEVPSDSEDSNNPLSSDSVSSESPPRLADLAASFRVFSESMARMDLAEMEMIKVREASRLEAEKRRMELEAELTRMMLQTQLQIASTVAGKGTSRKRKRVGEEEGEMPILSRGGRLPCSPSLLACPRIMLRMQRHVNNTITIRLLTPLLLQQIPLIPILLGAKHSGQLFPGDLSIRLARPMGALNICGKKNPKEQEGQESHGEEIYTKM